MSVFVYQVGAWAISMFVAWATLAIVDAIEGVKK